MSRAQGEMVPVAVYSCRAINAGRDACMALRERFGGFYSVPLIGRPHGVAPATSAHCIVCGDRDGVRCCEFGRDS